MKIGDWVIHTGDGRVGQITLLDYMPMYSLVDFQDHTFARMTNHNYLKPVAPPVADILNAVKQSLPVTNTN
jgi:hypothetical protein